MTESPRNSRLFLVLSGVAISLLLAAVFTLGSLRVPFEPHGWDELIALYALNTFIVAALLVFGLILGRTLIRLWAERRAEELGSRFKTKMVLGALAVSALPLVFYFFISYALMNRTLNRWFPHELEDANSQAIALLGDVNHLEYTRLQALANRAAALVPRADAASLSSTLDPAARLADHRLSGRAWHYRSSGGRGLGDGGGRGLAPPLDRAQPPGALVGSGARYLERTRPADIGEGL